MIIVLLVFIVTLAALCYWFFRLFREEPDKMCEECPCRHVSEAVEKYMRVDRKELLDRIAKLERIEKNILLSMMRDASLKN